jgi:hypothetical protein
MFTMSIIVAILYLRVTQQGEFISCNGTAHWQFPELTFMLTNYYFPHIPQEQSGPKKML